MSIDNGNEDLREDAQNIIEDVETRARDAAESLSAEASRASADLRRTLRSNANGAKEKASDSLIHAAEAIRAEAAKSDNDEVMRQAGSFARSMEKAALYLDSRTLEQLGEDAKEVVRENVWPTLGVAVGIGFLLGLLFGGGRRHD